MKKFIKVFLSLMVCILGGVLFSGCDDDLILVVGVDFYQDEIYASVGDEIDLSYKIYPSNATNKKVTYWSSDPSIAYVDSNGKVSVRDSGEAIIAVRAVDGGYQDLCKIVTTIDPDEIVWDTEDGRITKVDDPSLPYSGRARVAVDQVIKLDVKYLLNGEEDSKITNKNITFTSSDTNNIEVINAKEGILRAVDSNISSLENKAYSDITATLKTANGEKKIVCRVEINEYSSIENLYVNQVDGDREILNKRDGSEKIILDAEDSVGVDYYCCLLNISDYIKSDYDIDITSMDESVFKVKNIDKNDAVVYFTLVSQNEGSASLLIATTCADENGKQIEVVINVIVQAEVKSIECSATDRFEEVEATTRKVVYEPGHEGDDGYKSVQNAVEVVKNEIVVVGEIFSIDFVYRDKNNKIIENAERRIFFDSISAADAQYDGYVYYGCGDYIQRYGENNFKVTGSPRDINKQFYIKGYVCRQNNVKTKKDASGNVLYDASGNIVYDINEEDKVYFIYTFFIRTELDGIVVSENKVKIDEENGIEILPPAGDTALNIEMGKSNSLYAYAVAINREYSCPTNVNFEYDDSLDIISVTRSVSDSNCFTITGNNPGDIEVLFTASDGVETKEWRMIIHVYAIN